MEKTIKEEKLRLRKNFDEGTNCQCCGQFVKRYKRKLNSGMSRTMIHLYKNIGTNFVNVKEFLKRNNLTNNHDWTLLKHWNMLEEQRNTDPSKRDSGVWRLTKHGVEFLLGHITAPSHAYFFDGNCLGLETEKYIGIKESLGMKFNYQELMDRERL